MKVENPVALRFLLQDELYLLNTDKAMYENMTQPEPVTEDTAPVAPSTDKPDIAPKIIENPVNEVITQPIAFKYLGGNLKNFLVLVHYPQLDFIDHVHLTALSSIIKRKELGIDDIAILNLATYNTTHFDELLQFFKPTKLLVLGQQALPKGIQPLVLNIPKPLGGFTALYSFSFGEMMDSVDNKKAFWEQMKTL